MKMEKIRKLHEKEARPKGLKAMNTMHTMVTQT